MSSSSAPLRITCCLWCHDKIEGKRWWGCTSNHEIFFLLATATADISECGCWVRGSDEDGRVYWINDSDGYFFFEDEEPTAFTLAEAGEGNVAHEGVSAESDPFDPWAHFEWFNLGASEARMVLTVEHVRLRVMQFVGHLGCRALCQALSPLSPLASAQFEAVYFRALAQQRQNTLRVVAHATDIILTDLQLQRQLLQDSVEALCDHVGRSLQRLREMMLGGR